MFIPLEKFVGYVPSVKDLLDMRLFKNNCLRLTAI